MGEPPTSELTAEQKLAALKETGSNQGTVEAIAIGGHVTSGAIVAGRAIYLARTVGFKSARCFLGRLAAPLAAATAGAYVAEAIGADEWLMKLEGREPLAKRGKQAAHVEHKIAHNDVFGGFWKGLVAGVLVGAAVLGGVALVVGTGGLAAPVLGGLLTVGGAAGIAGGALGGFVGAAISGSESKSGHVTGKIAVGSPDVFFEGKPAARVTDFVDCEDHSGRPKIVQGSATIFINGLPMARIGHKIQCGAVIQEGCTTIFGDFSEDESQETYGAADADVSVTQQLIMSGTEVWGFASASREGGLLDALLRKLFGEPIDAATGDYASYRTDFEYPSALPLKLTRCYAGKHSVEGVLGAKWICNWSQRLIYSQDERSVLLEDADGQRLVFAMPRGQFDSTHLKASYYRLSGTWREARLFDTRTQQTLVFTASPDDPFLGRLSAIEDRNHNRIDLLYLRNRLQRVIHSDDVTFEVGTTTEGYLSWVSMAGDDQPVVKYSYNASEGLVAVSSRFGDSFHFEYDDCGWLTHWRDSGVTRVYLDYDERGRVVATRTPDGLYNDRFIYHPTQHRTEYIDGTGARRVLWFNHDNLVVREQDPLGNVTFYEWDALERKQSFTDAAGRVTQFTYDSFGWLIVETDWAGRTTRWEYNNQGLPTGIQHPDGLKSSFAYDGRGNLVSATRSDGAITTYTYDHHGRLLSETDPTGATGKWEYAAHGRVSALIDAIGGRTELQQDIWGRLHSVKNAAGFSTTYQYEAGPENSRAALSRIIHPDGGEERFIYDQEGLVAQHIGAKGQVRRFVHGAFNLLRKVTDPAGYSLSLDYDGAARVTRLTNAVGDDWVYRYDAAGCLAMETDWAGRETRYVRDALGRLQIKRLPDGVEQHFIWDNRDRIAGVATDTARIEYEYDDADRLTRAATYYLSGVSPQGPSHPASEVRLAYNKRGQLVQEVQNGMVISYRYDQAGRCVSVVSPSGETCLDFDARGLLATLESNGHALAFERDAIGLEAQWQYKTKVLSHRTSFTLQQTYDPCGRLAGQSAGVSRREQPSAFLPGALSRNYQWDKSGRLRGVQDSLRGKTNYRYDSRDQVLEVLRGQQRRGDPNHESYEYDALLNLACSNGKTHQYRHGQVEKIGNSTYEYDQRGRVVGKTVVEHGFRPQTWSYEWDDFDRLVEIHVERGERWRYSYDAFGRRTMKQCLTPVKVGAARSVTYLWRGAKVSEEWRTGIDNRALVAIDRWHYKLGAFQPIAKETLARTTEDPFALGKSDFYPVVTDQAGTPKELFNAEGVCVWKAEHSLWGNASVTGVRTDQECNLRFQGQWEDQESGLHYNLHRYYDPEGGQYLSPDPIALDGGTRNFGYVHSPLTWIDPLGLATCFYQNIQRWRDTTTGRFAKRPNDPLQMVNKGRLDYNDVQQWANEKALPNQFSPNPSKFPTGGFRYTDTDGVNDYSIWGHGANPNAPVGSNASLGPTASMRSEPAGTGFSFGSPRGLQNGSYGPFAGNENAAHIPLDNSPF